MQKYKNILVYVLLNIILFGGTKGFSQYDNIIYQDLVCGTNSQIPGDNPNQWPVFPLVGTHLHALVVFCNYPGDNFDPPGNNVCLMNYWPASQSQNLPSWAPYVISDGMSVGSDPNITNYFSYSSMGSFLLTGDVYPDIYIFDHTPSYYSDPTIRMGGAIGELLAGIDDKIDDWSIYDNFDPWDLDNDNDLVEPDGIVDFIFIVFRFTCSGTVDGYPSYTGIACLGGYSGQFGQGVNEYVTHDNLRILPGFPGSGCIGGVTNPWEIGILTHEFGEHYTYGYEGSTPMGAYHIRGGGLAAAYEREYIGWNSTSAITPTTNTNGIILRDYVTTNDYIKIPRANDDILYLENRRRLNYYSSVENIIWKWNCDDPVRPIQSDSMLVMYTYHGFRNGDIESAFGNFDWQMCPGDRFKTQWYTSRNNFFFTEAPNRYGLSTFDLHGCVSDINCNDIACNTGYWGAAGDFNTCFDVGYNDVISPWSNPPLLVANQNDSLTIEIAGRDANGNLLINVYFTNITDARPAKPQGLQIGWSECENGIKYPQLTWLHNLEPDMVRSAGPPTDFMRYKIYRAYCEIGQTPGPYTMIAEQNFPVTTNPVFVDSDASVECTSLGLPEVRYDVLYRVQAIDNTELASCLSDSVSTQVLKVREGDNNNFKSKPNLPKSYMLNQNYPNPFNPVTKINYEIPKDIFVTLKVYDILGREIKTLVNEFKNAGSYIVSFNGSDLASGIYFYRIQAGNFVQVKRMVLIK